MERSCQLRGVADFTFKGWISVDETHAFNAQHGFVQVGLAPELLHPASPSLHKPNPRTGIGVCQAGRAVLAPQGLEASVPQLSGPLSVLLPFCASPLCALPCLHLGKEEEGPRSPHWVREGLLLPPCSLRDAAVPSQHPAPGCKHLPPRSLGASHSCGFGRRPAAPASIPQGLVVPRACPPSPCGAKLQFQRDAGWV